MERLRARHAEERDGGRRADVAEFALIEAPPVENLLALHAARERAGEA